MKATSLFTLAGTRRRSGRASACLSRRLSFLGLRVETVAGLALLLASSLVLTAENGPSVIETNLDSEAMELLLSNVASEVSELVPTGSIPAMPAQEEGSAVDTNDPSGKLIPPAERESRRDWLSRQRAGAAGAGSEAAFANGQAHTNTAAQGDGIPVRPPYSSFQRIAQQNIFDPNRRSNRGRTRTTYPSTKAVESFALVGIISYEKGTFAFFDSTSSSYRKTVKNDDSIAGYKIAEIAPNAVKLAAGSNQLELHVGMKLRREAGGEWMLGDQAEAFAETPTSSSALSSDKSPTQEGAASGDNDVLERLRRKREQE